MAPSLARKPIATTWGKPSLSTVASAALCGCRRNSACSSGVSWISPRRLIVRRLHASVGLRRRRVEDRLGDQARALVAALGRLVAVRQSDEALAASVGVEGRARRVLHAPGRGDLPEPPGIGPGGQLDPDEEPALGTADLDVGLVEQLPQALEHRVA